MDICVKYVQTIIDDGESLGKSKALSSNKNI